MIQVCIAITSTALTVQSSYKLNLPATLIIHHSNISMTETVGQGSLTSYVDMHYKRLLVVCLLLQVSSELSTKVILSKTKLLLRLLQ